MLVTKRALLGAVVAATVVFAGLGAGTAQAAPDGGKSDRATAARVDASLTPDRGAKAKVTESAAATAALTAIQKRISGYVAKNGAKYSFASYFDSRLGRIVVETDAPDTVVSSLTSTAGLASASAQVAASTQVRKTAIDDRFSRRDDVPNYYGGGGITQTTGVGWCSSGYTVQNSAGTRYMVTAGHCFADGTAVLTELGGRAYGTVFARRLPTVTGHPRDMELISGGGYWGRIFTGGVDSSTSAVVVAAGGAVVGFADYCHSGRTTGENCGHTATSVTGQVCTSTGCKSPVIVFTGGTLPAGGDSGSPFYVKDSSGNAWIRGHVIAGGGGTAYATPWLEVAADYGVSIVTG